MAITTQEKDQILKVVAGLFNGAPGGAFLNDFSQAVEAGTTIPQLADILVGTSQFQSLISGMNQAAQTDFLLTNFGFNPTATDAATLAAKEFVTTNFGLGLGQITYLAVEFLSTTTDPLFADAAALLNNKALVAGVHAENVATVADVNAGQSAFAGVDKDGPTTPEAALQLLVDGGIVTPPGLTFTLSAAASATEGSALTFTVTASEAVTEDTDVVFTVVPGAPGADDQGTNTTNLNDFIAGTFNPVTVKILAGQTTATFDVTGTNDGKTELPESYSVEAVVGGQTLTKTATLLDGQSGQTFVLTTSVDTIIGTSGNDTINADITVDAVMSAADSINGGAGVDTLRIFDNATNTITLPTTLTSVENISVHFGSTVGEDLNIASLTDVTSLSIEAATVASTSTDIDLTIGAGQAVTLKNVLATGDETDTVNINAATSVTSASLTLNGAGDAATAADELNIDIVGGGIDTLNIATTGTASNIGLANAGTALKTLNISGDKALTVRTSFDPAGTSGTIAATGMSGDLTFSTATANDAITFTGGSGKNTITTGSGADSLTGGASNDTLNAGTGNDTVVGGAGDDTITVGAGTANVDAGAGDDVVSVAGLDATDILKGGDGTADVLALVIADADAADAGTASGTALRATYSDFEILRLDAVGNNQIAANTLGFNSVQIAGDVTSVAAAVTGLTSGATIEFRNAADQTSALIATMTDAAINTNDVLNVNLNADLFNSSAFVTKVTVNGINAVNVNAVDRVDDAAATDDNGPDDGYTIDITDAANMTNLNITGTAAVGYTLAAGTNAVKTIDASASTGNMTINVSAFAGTERVTIKGSQGVNTITGDDASFGEAIIGGAKGDSITAGVGADDITGNGGRDAFIQLDGDSVATAMDHISDFGKVTVAATAAEVTDMNNISVFQATATAKGGDNADLLDVGTVAAVLAGAQTAADVETAITGGAGTETVTAVESAKGILTLGGADLAQIDTLTEWIAVANIMAAVDADVVGFEFSGNTYIFQQETTGPDTVTELTGVTGVTGIVVIGSAVSVAAAVDDIFVM